MSLSDPIGDLITRIRNGQRVHKSVVLSPHSKARENILAVLKDEGYIRHYEVQLNALGHKELSIELKYHEGRPVIQEIKRVSKPGRRVYSGIDDLKPVYNNLGINIISSSQGVLSDIEAKKRNVGGEVLCTVY